MQRDPKKTGDRQRWRMPAGFRRVLGPALGLAVYVLLAGTELSPAGRATAAVAAWMATWWMTEAIPIFATALLPLALFPLLGIADVRDTAAPYGNPLIFLFLGGFVIAIAMERWGLHQRIATTALAAVGHRADRVVGAFIGITAFLSMWISNTATATMMLPIALSLIARADGQAQHDVMAERNFGLALLLGLAYGASLGGVATLVGTPPNLFLASYAREHLGIEIGFARWMGMALPMVLVWLVLLWLLLTRVLFPVGGLTLDSGQAADHQPTSLSAGEKATLFVFLAAALLWVTRPLLADLRLGSFRPLAGLTDTGIAMLAAVSLFLLPAGEGRRAMDWEHMRRMPWGVLVLFGGGLSLAAAMQDNGVSAWIGEGLEGFAGLSPILVLALATALMVFLTELTSNTATTAAMVPVYTAAAQGLGLPPMMLAAAAAVAASCAFMLPVATPPNAIVFASGRLHVADMARAGIWMNFMSILFITAWAWLLLG
ncbi:MAG: DASS family sodium-coupled anion symporter [Gammaproteobacteria bacterium]